MIRTSSTSMRTSNIVMDLKKYSHDMETSFPIFDSQKLLTRKSSENHKFGAYSKKILILEKIGFLGGDQLVGDEDMQQQRWYDDAFAFDNKCEEIDCYIYFKILHSSFKPTASGGHSLLVINYFSEQQIGRLE